jgi:protein phosphatase
MILTLPQPSALIVLAPSAFPAAQWARRHFTPAQLLDPSDCQALLGSADLPPSPQAYALAAQAFKLRMEAGTATVLLQAPLEQTGRNFIRSACRAHHMQLLVLSIELSVEELQAWAPDFDRAQWAREQDLLEQNLHFLGKEGVQQHFRVRGAAELDGLEVVWQPLPCDRATLGGPFDLIGSLHGCHDELLRLFVALGYSRDTRSQLPVHPEGRLPVFLGDIADSGPACAETLSLVQAMTEAGLALAVAGNQDRQLLEHLRQDPEADPGALAPWWAHADAATRAQALAWLGRLPGHIVLDGGRLVAVHGGIKAEMIGRHTTAITAFCTYGSTPGERSTVQDAPIADWAADLPAGVTVAFAHQPLTRPLDAGNHVALDTACLYGGQLSAFRYPERAWVQVEASAAYLAGEWPAAAEAQAARPHALDRWTLPAELLNGRWLVQTASGFNFTLTDLQYATTLELLQNEAISPRWLIYLPPSMSPPQPATLPGFLEHPNEAFSYYEKKGQTHVVVQEKCDGPRAVVVLCRDTDAAEARFGDGSGRIGVVYSRRGRPLLDPADENTLLAELHAAATDSGLWAALRTDWLCLEGQLTGRRFTPGKNKEEGRIAAGVAAAWPRALDLLAQSTSDAPEFLAMRAQMEAQAAAAQALARDCTPADGDEGSWYFTPYHLLAAQSGDFFDRSHVWHLEQLAAFTQGNAAHVRALRTQVIDLQDHDGRRALTDWWQDLSDQGAPGIIVKPMTLELVVNQEYLQPALKVRGREALRKVYGPYYTLPDALEHHRRRSLKERRELVVRHFALGKEALQRFVAGKAHQEVLQAVFTHIAISTMDDNPLL